MPEWLGTTEFLNGLSVVGTWTLIGLALITGRGLALTREVKQRDVTIEWQRLSIAEKDATILELTRGTRVTVDAFDKVSKAAVEAGAE